MRIRLPFPKCPVCHEENETSIHKDCGGTLEIEVNTDEVYCTKCGHHWNIWDSNYHCTCGHVFAAKDIQSTLATLLAMCHVCAREIENQRKYQSQRSTVANESLRHFAYGFFQKIGEGFGIAIGIFVESFIRFLKGF